MQVAGITFDWTPMDCSWCRSRFFEIEPTLGKIAAVQTQNNLVWMHWLFLALETKRLLSLDLLF